MGSDIFCVGKGEVTAKWMNPKVRPPPKVRPLLGPTTSWTESKTPGLTFRREVYIGSGRGVARMPNKFELMVEHPPTLLGKACSFSQPYSNCIMRVF